VERATTPTPEQAGNQPRDLVGRGSRLPGATGKRARLEWI